MIAASARRLAVFLGVVVGGTAFVSGLLALITSHGLARVVSLGYYAVGALCVFFGFALGTRGPFRTPRRDEARTSPVAEPQEIRESISSAGLLIFVGLLLLVIGVAVDSRVKLV